MSVLPPYRFDGRNEAAIRAAERQAAEMVTAISDETRAALRALVVRGIREQIPVYDLARLIRALIGLNGPQAEAAMAYRETLINEGVLSFDSINRLVDKYAAKLLRQRAITIARTEIMGALNRGVEASWKDAQRKGLIGKHAKKEWMALDDGKCTQGTCPPLDGVTVPLDAAFSTNRGPMQRPPAHPRCRCAVAVLPE